jgi:hypothetical protein
MLQDAFAQTATQTAALLTTQKQRDAKPERQAVLKLLAAFTEADLHETLSDSAPAKDTLSIYPAPLAEWNHELAALLKDFLAHRAAVELIQGRHFDGHPILLLNLEAELTETARTIESAVTTANEYLMHRAELRGAKTNVGASETNPPIALESIKATACGQRAVAIAEQWLEEATFEAIETDAEQWKRWREEFAPVEHDTASPFV